MKQQAKEKSDNESESEEESASEEEGEEEFIPTSNKRPLQSNGDSFSKKPKLDNAGRLAINMPPWLFYCLILTITEGSTTLFVGNLSYDVYNDALTEFFTSHNLNPTSTRIIEGNDGSSRG